MENVVFGVSETSSIINHLLIQNYTSDVQIHCPGQSGHGSLLMENTPGEKVSHILKRFYEFRKSQQKLLKDNPTWTIGDVTTINCTMMSVSSNCTICVYV